MKHITPGPWAYKRGDVTGTYSLIGGYGIFCPTQDYITAEETEANANLMAAAPDLLKAAQDALALLKKGAPGWGVAKDILNAAIHKATQ